MTKEQKIGSQIEPRIQCHRNIRFDSNKPETFQMVFWLNGGGRIVVDNLKKEVDYPTTYKMTVKLHKKLRSAVADILKEFNIK